MTKMSAKLNYIDTEMQGIRFLEEIIERLDKELVYLQNCFESNNALWLIKEAKLKREKLKAFAAMSKTKVLIAELEVFLTEHEQELDKYVDKNNLEQSQHANKYSNTPGRRNQRYAPYSRSLTSSSHSPSSSSNVSSDSLSTVSTYNSSMQYTEDNSLAHITPKNIQSYTNDSFLMNKTTSIIAQSSVRTPSQNATGKSNSLVNKSDSNKSITESVIGEFNKPNWNKHSSIGMCSSTPKLNMSLPTVPKKRVQNVKINPVSNIEAFKKGTSASDALSYKSHVLYTPNGSNFRRPLHPRDPRAYLSKLSLEPRHQGVSRPPISLPVPSMTQNNVYTPQKKRPVEKSMQASYISTPKQIKNKQVPIQSAIQELTPLQNILNHTGLTNMAYTTPMKQPNHRQLPDNTPVKNTEHRQLPDITPIKKSKYRHDIVMPTSISLLNSYNKNGHKPATPIREPERQNYLASNTIHNRQMPASTPQKWSENKHICVPVPPMYNHRTSQNLICAFKENMIPGSKLEGNSSIKEFVHPVRP